MKTLTASKKTILAIAALILTAIQKVWQSFEPVFNYFSTNEVIKNHLNNLFLLSSFVWFTFEVFKKKEDKIDEDKKYLENESLKVEILKRNKDKLTKTQNELNKTILNAQKSNNTFLMRLQDKFINECINYSKLESEKIEITGLNTSKVFNYIFPTLEQYDIYKSISCVLDSYSLEEIPTFIECRKNAIKSQGVILFESIVPVFIERLKTDIEYKNKLGRLLNEIKKIRKEDSFIADKIIFKFFIVISKTKIVPKITILSNKITDSYCAIKISNGKGNQKLEFFFTDNEIKGTEFVKINDEFDSLSKNENLRTPSLMSEYL